METSPHPAYLRLLDEAQAKFEIFGPTAVAAAFTAAGVPVSIQNMGNWKSRGLPGNKSRYLARCLGVTQDWLLEGKEPKYPRGLLDTAGWPDGDNPLKPSVSNPFPHLMLPKTEHPTQVQPHDILLMFMDMPEQERESLLTTLQVVQTKLKSIEDGKKPRVAPITAKGKGGA